MVKKKVLFVGAFNATSGNVGGQLFACCSLVESNLSEHVSWRLIDTTAATNQERSTSERMLKAIPRLIEFIGGLLRFRPDTVLIFFADRGSLLEKGLMAVMARMFGRRVVLCPRSGLLISDIRSSKFWKKYTRFVFRCAHTVVCQGESWKDFFEQHIGLSPEKYIVIRNWIVLDRYAENFEHHQKRSAATKLRILFMGWVTKEKGIFDLLKAYQTLPFTHTEMLIAGDGNDLVAAKGESVNLKIDQTTKFLGWVFDNDKHKLLREADIFVLPSYYEGLPNALLEAMASGVPAIATRVGGIPDLIRSGENGFLVEPGDVDGLAEKIALLIQNEDKRKSFSLSAYNHVKNNHSLQAAVSRFKELL